MDTRDHVLGVEEAKHVYNRRTGVLLLSRSRLTGLAQVLETDVSGGR